MKLIGTWRWLKVVKHSWKDEWLTILFSIPLILAFIPGMEEVVANGFAQLQAMPEWYQYSLGVIVAASFGVRSATKFFERNRRGRTYYGKNAEVEDTPPFDDVGNVDFSMARSGMVYVLPDPTSQQAALVSVVTGAMTGAFAVWMGHEKNEIQQRQLD